MSISLGNAKGYLDLDISDFRKKLKEANEEASKTGKSIGQGFLDGTKSLGEAFTSAGAAMTKGITVPVLTGIAASVKAFGNLEQSIGGVEAIFGKTSSTVIKNSETAYRRAGLDANAYLESVTSFSQSLLKSVGGDTKKAAKLADMAMVDMSDNANRFGTNIGLIQNAYQGFAKNNYSMLDNLKLGYGGTREQMQKLLDDANKWNAEQGRMTNYQIDNYGDMVSAIHDIQVAQGTAGTTAKEAAETINGSWGMAKASFMDFIAGLGNSKANIKKLEKNLIDSIGIFIKNVKRTIGTIWDNLPISPVAKFGIAALAALGPILLVIGKMMTSFVNFIGFIGKLKGAFSALSATWSAVSGIMLSSGASVGATLSALALPITAVVAAVVGLGLAFRHLWKTNERFRETIKGMFSGLSEPINKIRNVFKGFGIEFKSVSDFIKKAWDAVCNILAPVFVGAFKYISTYLKGALDVISGIIQVFGGILKGDWSAVWGGLKDIVVGAFNIITAPIQAVIESIKYVMAPLAEWFSAVWGRISTNAVLAWNAIRDAVSSVLNFIWGSVISPILNTIANFITTTWNSIVAVTTAVFNGLKAVVQIAWSAIKDFIINPIKTAWSVGTSIVNAIASTVGSGFSRAASIVSNVWSSVYNFITSPLHKAWSVVSSVVNKLKSAFNFSWSLPHLKLPHISVSGGTAPFGIGGKGSLPKFSIKWYKDAMDKGMILDNPTVFGYKNGRFLGGGEAGAEVVVGRDSLLAMIRQAVVSTKLGVDSKLISLIIEGTNSANSNVISSNSLLLQKLDELVGIIKGSERGKGDTFVFNSPEPINEVEAARQMKKQKRELLEGF